MGEVTLSTAAFAGGPPHRQSALRDNPAGWPRELLEVFERSITVEYASLTRAGQPITFPCTPYVGDDGRTLDVSTGLTYPAKAERARRNPSVALLYADPIGAGLTNPPIVLVQGRATVRDADLQWTTDRYVRLSFERFPGMFSRLPKFLIRRLNYYWTRMWVQVTPLRILWWPEGSLDRAPHEWRAPEGTTAPASDPPPRGRQPSGWMEAPTDWRLPARSAAADLSLCDLTVVGADGAPIIVPLSSVELHPEGFRLQLASGPKECAGLLDSDARGSADGYPACVTFHTHPEQFTSQENKVFVGRVTANAGGVVFRVERLLGDWSLSKSQLRLMLDLLVTKRRRLLPHLAAEAARRNQPVPRIRVPGEY